MSATNKNFIVKNGLQVGNDLIVANTDTNKVGIASTVPTSTFSVAGEIATDNLVASGISTITQLKGTQVSYTQVDASTLNAVSGVVTSLTGSNINISGEVKSNRLAIGVAGSIFSATSSGVGVGTTLPSKHFEVVGDANVTGALSALVVNSNINSSGVSTFTSANVTNLQSTDFNVLGISTLGFANATRLTVSSNTLLGITTTGPLTAAQLNVTGITTIGNINASQLSVTGVSTLANVIVGTANSVAIGTNTHVASLTIGDVSTIVPQRGGMAVKTLPNSSTVAESAIYIEEQTGNEGWYLTVDVDGDLNFNNSSSSIHSVEFLDDDSVVVRKGHLGIMTSAAQDALTVLGNARITGVTTLTTTTTSALNASQLNVTGVTTVVDLKATQTTITGVSTLGVVNASQLSVTGVSTFAGITTVTGSTLFSKQVDVSGVSTFRDATTHQKGISVTGIANVTGVNATGVITATTFSGNATTASVATYASNAGVATYASTSGISTSVSGGFGSLSQLNVTGFSTLGVVNASQLNVTGVTTLSTTNTNGLSASQLNVTGFTTLGVSTSTVLSTNTLRVAGISTYVTGPILVGSATSTGTADQKLQVTGKAYVSSAVGIGSTNPTTALDVVGSIKVLGTITGNAFSGPGIVTSIIDGAGSDAVEVSPGVYKIDLYGSAIGEAWGTVQNGAGEIGVRTDVLVGVGTTVPPEYTLDVSAKYEEEAARFLVKGSNVHAPFIVNSNVQVNNLNAQFLGGKSAPSGSIVGTTDSQTLSSKTLTLPTIQGTGANFSGSTSGSINLLATATAGSNTITLPATTGTVITTGDSGTVTSTMIANDSITNTDINSSAAIAYSKLNLSGGIVNADINASAAIAISKLASSTISGISLGSNLNNLTIGSYLTQNGQTYNGSTARTVAVDADTANTGSKVVVRDASGNFAAGTVTVNALSATNENVSGISTLGNLKTLPLLEKVNVVAGAVNATANIDVLTSNVWIFTTAAAANWTHNIRGNASVSLNTLMATGDSIVVTILAKKSSTTHYATDITIDGGAQTELWLGGAAPTVGLTASNYDMYTWTIIKTAASTFTVLGSQSQYGA
jgi:hypothetical protein